MDDYSEIQELAESPREISAAHGKSYLLQVLNVVCVLIILWLARDWLLQPNHWLDSHFHKEIAKRLGTWSGAIGSLYFVGHTFLQISLSKAKKKQKRAEEEKKQFNPRYNPIAEQDSESWSHERNHD
jgi:hypothetical protein